MTRQLKPRLAGHGFKKRKTQVFTVPIVEDVTGWLGLSASLFNHPAGIMVTPIVGIRFERVYSVAQQWAELDLHPYAGPMPSRAIGYVMPENQDRYWEFFDPQVLEPTLSDMVQSILEYALPWMHWNSTLEHALPAMEDRRHWGVIPFQLIVAYLHLGKQGKALDLLDELDERAAGGEDKKNPYLVRFRNNMEKALQAGGIKPLGR